MTVESLFLQSCFVSASGFGGLAVGTSSLPSSWFVMKCIAAEMLGLASTGEELCSDEPGVGEGVFFVDCNSVGLGGGTGGDPLNFGAFGGCTGFLGLRPPSEKGCMKSLVRLGGRAYDGVGTSLVSTDEAEVPTRLVVEMLGVFPFSIDVRALSRTVAPSSDFLRRPPHTRRSRPLALGGSGNGGGLKGVDGASSDASDREAPWPI